MRNKLIAIALSSILLTGCATNDLNQLNPLHISDVYQKVNMSEVTFKIPTSSLDVNKGLGGVLLETSAGINYKKLDADTFEVHRRVGNGTAGSGTIYNVDYTTVKSDEMSTITFKPVEMKTYQQGFIGKFDIPKLDIIKYLNTARFSYEFEVDSEYPENSIASNFSRNLTKVKKYKGKDVYRLELSNSNAYISIKSYPYKNGSKTVVTAGVETIANESNNINLDAIYKEITEKVTNIVNS